MIRSLRVLALAAALSCAAAACGPTKPDLPDLPESVTRQIEVEKPFPAWTKAPLPVAEPKGTKLSDLLVSHLARGNVLLYANCRAELMEQLDLKREVDPASCDRFLKPDGAP